MDWSDYQSTTYNLAYSTVAFVDNVGNAEINGVEIDATYKVDDTLTLNAYVVSNDPTLSEDYYDVSGVLQANSGNRLAYVPETSYVIGIDKVFEVAGRPGYFNMDYSYTGDRFTSQENTTVMPEYTIGNMRVGVEGDNSLMEIYITNFTDEVAYLTRYDDFSDIRRTPNRPRVIGFRIKYRY